MAKRKESDASENHEKDCPVGSVFGKGETLRHTDKRTRDSESCYKSHVDRSKQNMNEKSELDVCKVVNFAKMLKNMTFPPNPLFIF